MTFDDICFDFRACNKFVYVCVQLLFIIYVFMYKYALIIAFHMWQNSRNLNDPSDIYIFFIYLLYF